MNKYLPVLLTSLFLIQNAQAIDVDAGDYDYAPSGTNLGILYYQYATRNGLYSGSEKQSGNYQLDTDVAIARYAHYMSVGNFQIAPQIFLPYARLESGKDNSAYGKNSGLSDIIIAMAFFPYHDEATKTNIGITPYLYLPTGKYSVNKALNPSENRYKFVLQGGYTTQLFNNLLFDAVADFTVYGDNDDVGDGKLKQDLGYQIQSSLRYKIQPQWDIRAGLSYSNAGDTEKNNVNANAVKQMKYTIGTAYSPTPRTQFIVNYGRDIQVENFFKENNRINLRFLYAF